MVKRVILCLLAISTPSVAEDLNTIFQNVNKYVADKNYSKALSELGWAKKEIEKLHTAKLQEFFPSTLAGFQGEPIEAGSAIGIMNISKKYAQGAKGVTVSITGGSGGDTQAGFAGLAQLGALASAFGGAAPGAETFRLAGRTATLMTEKGSNPELTVILQSGSILRLEADNPGVDGETLKKMAGELKIEDIDTYLKASA